MKVAFLALGIFGREGGMERFNRRVLLTFDRMLQEGRLEAVSAVALWDKEVDSGQAPRSIRFIAGRQRKMFSALAFLRAVRNIRPEAILYGHILLVPLAPVARLLSPASRHIMFAHGYEVWDPPNQLVRTLVRRFIDVIAAVSNFTARRMSSAYGIDPECFRIVINAVDVPPSEPIEHDRQRPGRPTLLSVARLDRRDRDKHIDKVVRAIPEIAQVFPNVSYRVVGSGDWGEELRELANTCGVQDQIDFLGSVDDQTLRVLFRSSDVFVLPSTQEGFGIVYLEAWSHRLPVIAGDGGAAPEIVRDGEDGLVVPPSPHEIATAVCNLLADESLRRRLGEAGYQRFVSAYTDEHFHAAIYRVLIENAKR